MLEKNQRRYHTESFVGMPGEPMMRGVAPWSLKPWLIA